MKNNVALHRLCDSTNTVVLLVTIQVKRLVHLLHHFIHMQRVFVCFLSWSYISITACQKAVTPSACDHTRVHTRTRL